MITRANKRKHQDKYWRQVVLIRHLLLKEPREEAEEFCRSLAYRWKLTDPKCRYAIADFHPEDLGANHYFHLLEQDIFNSVENRREELTALYQKEYEIKKQWKLDNQKALVEIEKSVWGDLVSKHPKRVAP